MAMLFGKKPMISTSWRQPLIVTERQEHRDVFGLGGKQAIPQKLDYTKKTARPSPEETL